MNIDKFYRMFMEDRKLAKMHVANLKDKEKLQQMASILNEAEQQLIHKLKDVHPMNGYFEVAYDGVKYPTLTSQMVILSGGGSGVIHTWAVTALSRALKAQSKVVEMRPQRDGHTDGNTAHNAMRLRITLEDAHVPIWREVVVPIDLNFYELHLTIQDAMGWNNSHLAVFMDEGYEVFVFLADKEEWDGSPSFTKRDRYVASETSVHNLLAEKGHTHYIYDFGDDWHHTVEVKKYLTLEAPVLPHVDRYEGPMTIDDAGGVDGLEEVLEIVGDRAHPEHTDVLDWAVSSGYEQKYPKASINNVLKQRFSGRRPVTEFSDSEVDEEGERTGVEEMVHTYLSTFSARINYDVHASAEDYISAIAKYTSAPLTLSDVVGDMTDKEINEAVRNILDQYPAEVYYCYGIGKNFTTLAKALLVVPTSGVAHAHGVIHQSIAEPLIDVLFSKDNPKHPGKLHVKNYRLEDELAWYIDFMMTVAEIKSCLKVIGFRGYSKLKKKELVEAYIKIITSKEEVEKILYGVHPVELLILNRKLKEDPFPFWASTEPSRDLYENGLLFESMYDGVYMHPDVTNTVRMIDIDAIIDMHIKAGRLKTE